MASPIGHTAVGVAAAAVAVRVTGTPDSALLWLGTPVASLLPDLDLGLKAFGLWGPKYHRNQTHSIAFVAAVILGGWALHAWVGLTSDSGTLIAWAAALATHPFLDVITTGPTLGRMGWGIPLLWPFSRRRFYVNRPLLVGHRGESESWRDTMQEMREEVLTFGLLGVAVFAVIRFF